MTKITVTFVLPDDDKNKAAALKALHTFYLELREQFKSDKEPMYYPGFKWNEVHVDEATGNDE